MNTNGSQPEKNSSVTFSLFADFHYKAGAFVATVENLDIILERANANSVDLIMQLGDICNDFIGSPELINKYLDNPYGIPAYGVYGNHDLESKNNTMEFVTPRLTNRKDNVVWGTADGKIGDGYIGYYYFDAKGFRFICLDTNYSWNPAEERWEHNYNASYHPPKENIKKESLGPEQLAWLEKVLNDAADKNIPCIVSAHSGFSGIWYSSPDAAAVRELYKSVNTRCPGTVLLSMNGHYHHNRTATVDGVVYFSVNSSTIGHFWIKGEPHYTTETFHYKEYDDNGVEIPDMSYERLVSSVSISKLNWFFTKPLNCIVTVNRNGIVTVDGQTTEWIGGIVPPSSDPYVMPEISSGVYCADGKKD